MPLYNFRSVNRTNGWFPPEMIFPANPGRVSIILSVGDPGIALARLFLYATSDQLMRWALFELPANITLAYRDYGPLIQSQVWAASTVGSTAEYSFSEIFAVPSR